MQTQNLTGFFMDDLKQFPTLTNSQPYHKVSEKYTFVPTMEVLTKLYNHGWFATEVWENQFRIEGKAGYQKHMVKLFHKDLKGNGERLQGVLINSHDRSSLFNFSIGFFRFVCHNGMLVGDTFGKVKTKHIGSSTDDIIEASYQIVKEAPKAIQTVDDMKSIPMQLEDRRAYAAGAAKLLETKTHEIVPNHLDYTNRLSDQAGNLWNVFNTVQENVTKGRFYKKSKEDGKVRKAKAIKEITPNNKMNEALWTFTEKVMEYKQAA